MACVQPPTLRIFFFRRAGGCTQATVEASPLFTRNIYAKMRDARNYIFLLLTNVMIVCDVFVAVTVVASGAGEYDIHVQCSIVKTRNIAPDAIGGTTSVARGPVLQGTRKQEVNPSSYTMRNYCLCKKFFF